MFSSAGAKAELESEVDCGMVLCADDPELLDKLDWAAETGQSLEAYKFCLYFLYFQTSQYLPDVL